MRDIKNRKKLTISMENLPAISRILVLGLIIFFGYMINSSFISPENASNVLTNASIFIIIGIGQTIASITNGPDLSSGSIMTISAVVTAILMKSFNVNFIIAILAGVLLGCILGAINGYLIAYIGIPSFISTYGLMWAVFGFAYFILNGYVIYNFSPVFRFIGNGTLIGRIQMPIVVMIILVILGMFILNKTTFGRKCYAVGSNRETAKMSGINDKTVIVKAFIYSGLFAAIAGIVFIARMNAVQADIGTAYLLPVLATVYMGGTSPAGGEGSILGTVVGALIITIVTNCMNILAVPSEWRDGVIGIIIIGTVLLDLVVKKRMSTGKKISV
jgi:ribose transport system permease protein